MQYRKESMVLYSFSLEGQHSNQDYYSIHHRKQNQKDREESILQFSFHSPKKVMIKTLRFTPWQHRRGRYDHRGGTSVLLLASRCHMCHEHLKYCPPRTQKLCQCSVTCLKTKSSRRLSHLFPQFHLCSRFHSCVGFCPELSFNTKCVTKLKGKTERDKCRQTYTGRGNCPAPVPAGKDFQVQLQSKSITEWEILTSDERYGTFILEAHLLVHFTICVF